MSLIDIKNLSVTYFLGKSNEVKALSNANLQIEAGEFIIFFGASGCGKSTLLYTIAGLEKPTSGSVVVNGVDLATMKNKELENYRQHTIGMVFQAFYLIPSLSVVKNVVLPKMAVGALHKGRKEEADRLLKYFGVYEQKRKLPSELSGGQQQRVAICRALINNPDIIFADEPVGNLDSKSAQDVLGLIQELNLKGKKTVVLVTHDPSHLDVADRVFFMKDGSIVDIKVNKETRKITPSSTVPADDTKTALEPVLATKGVSGGGFGLDTMLLSYKAREVVSEALTGLTTKELADIEQYVKGILQDKIPSDKNLELYLEKDFEAGGLNLGKRTAHRMVEKIRSTVEEMRILSNTMAEENTKPLNFAKQLRRYLLDRFDVMIGSTDALLAIDQTIEDRILGITDRKGVQSRFDIPLNEGGAGIDRRIARKMAKHLELVLLGRFNTSRPSSQTYQESKKLDVFQK